jgi:hypothetical protein
MNAIAELVEVTDPLLKTLQILDLTSRLDKTIPDDMAGEELKTALAESRRAALRVARLEADAYAAKALAYIDSLKRK